MARQIRSSDFKLEVQGLREFQRALALVADEYPEQIKQENVLLANRLKQKAQRRGAAQGGVVAKGARSLKVAQSSREAAIIGGTTGSRTDRAVFFGAEFGSKRKTRGRKIPVNAHASPKQKHGFKPWRGNQFQGWAGGPGYFLHPTIRQDGPRALEAYMEALGRLESRAFPQ